MSQIVVTSKDTGIVSEDLRRKAGMQHAGQRIRIEINNGKDPEEAFTDSLVYIIDNEADDYLVEYTDPSGHTGKMSTQTLGGKKVLYYENSGGVDAKVMIKYHADQATGGTQHMNIGGSKDGGELINPDYLNGLVLEVGWKTDPNLVDPEERDYFIATVNLRRCS